MQVDIHFHETPLCQEPILELAGIVGIWGIDQAIDEQLKEEYKGKSVTVRIYLDE